jgi:hypothetical protein
VLVSSLGVLGCFLPPHDGFLLLTEPLNFLLDSDQFLLLLCSIIFIGFFILVLHLNLFKLDIALDDLYWRRCPRGD